MQSIILPDDPTFYQTLSNIPSNFFDVAKETGKTNLIADVETGILKQVEEKDLIEYLYGGEYDEVEEGNNIFFGDIEPEIIWH